MIEIQKPTGKVKNGILLPKSAKLFRSMEQFIQTLKGPNNFW